MCLHTYGAGPGLAAAAAVQYPRSGIINNNDNSNDSNDNNDYIEDDDWLLFIPNADDYYSPSQCTCEFSGRTTPDAELGWVQPIDEQDYSCSFEDASPPDPDLLSDTESEDLSTAGEVVVAFANSIKGMTNVRSLKDMATKACVRNSAYLFSVGQLPYAVVRPILLTIENHEQLRQIELASPQIMGDDAEIWRKLILRDIPGAAKKMVEPSDPAKWYKVYHKLKKGEDRDLDAATKALAAGIKAANAPREALRAGTITAMPPQGIKRGSAMVLGGRPGQPKIIKYSPRNKAGDRFSNVRQVNRPGHIVRDVGMPTISRGVASNTTGKGMLDRAKQEAKIVKTYRKATPTHLLNYFKNPKNQITSVPKSMASASVPSTTAREERANSQNKATLPAVAKNSPNITAGRSQGKMIR